MGERGDWSKTAYRRTGGGINVVLLIGLLVLTCLMGTLVFLRPVTVLAETDSGYPQVIVEDGAGLLTDEDEARLYDAASALAKETGWDIRLVTTDDAQGKEAVDYAEDYFMDHYRQDDGFVGLLDMDNREIYLATSGAAIYYLTDDWIDRILDEAYEYVSGQDYYRTLRAMVDGAGEAYDEGLDSSHYTYNEDTGEIVYYVKPKSVSFGEALFALGAGIVACLSMIGIVSAGYKKKGKAYHYSVAGNTSLELTRKTDQLVNQFTTRRRIPRNPPPSAGGGGGGHSHGRSTIHTGSGGHSFGGGGRKF